VEVFHEAIELILIDIEDSSHTALNSTHLTDLLCNSRLPVLAEDAVTLSSVKGLTLTVCHLDGKLVLLSSDQTTGSKGLLVVTRNVGKGHAEIFSESFVGILRLLNKLGSGISEERKDSSVNLLKVLQNVSGRSSDDIFGLGDTNTGKLNSSLTLDVFH
jgi:hypothetical protein